MHDVPVERLHMTRALRTLSGVLLVLALAAAEGAAQQAPSGQDGDVSRTASLLQLAVEEYAAAVGEGEIVNQMEYDETEAFVRQARDRYQGLLQTDGKEAPAGARRLVARFDSLVALVDRTGDPAEFRRQADVLVRRLSDLWGAAPIQLPSRPPSAAGGAELYRSACAACHGAEGRGDGRAAEGMTPPPPDLTAEPRHAGATPARDYQVVTFGIPRTAMPESGDWLSVEKRWDVVAYLQSLRFGGAEVAEGEALLAVAGSDPAGAGERQETPARALATRIRRWSSVEGGLRLTDRDLASEIRRVWRKHGGDSLSEDRTRSLVAYARALMGTPASGLPAPDRSVLVAEQLAEVDSLVGSAMALHGEGDAEAARGRALEAYLRFEAVESELRARDPGLASAAEASFSSFRSALGTPEASSARDELDARLEQVEQTLASISSGWDLAGKSFFIILREGFEAILIIGAIIAFLVKTGHGEKRRTVYGGVGLALAASALTAVAMETIFAITPADREVLEGATLLLATAVLFSVSYWLLSKLEHRKWEAYLQDKLQRAVGAGGGLALAGVAFLAVYREGFETVLFYKALLISGSGASAGGALVPVAAGFGVGCVALAVLYLLFTRFGVRMPLRPFFAVTSGVLYYMALVFAGQGIHELQAAGVVGLTHVAGVPRAPLLGLYPTMETLAAQALLLLALTVALVFTFRPGSGEPEAVDAGMEPATADGSPEPAQA